MPPLDPIPRDLPEVIAAAAVIWAALQLVLARWRDLAPVTIGVAACALVLRVAPYTVGAVVLALAISGVAQARGARRGVGRPAIVGLTLAVVAAGGLLPLWLPAIVPGVDPERLRAVAIVPCALAGAIGGLLALERPGIRPTPPRWFGAIPVEGAPRSSRADAPEQG